MLLEPRAHEAVGDHVWRVGGQKLGDPRDAVTDDVVQQLAW